MQLSINKFLYPGFVLFGLYFLIISRNYTDAVINLGIALAFDPFNLEQPWNERPLWQRAVLLLHLACVFALFGYQIGFNDKL